MLTNTLIEKQLEYSGFNLEWLKLSLQKNDIVKNVWEETIKSIPDDSIVYGVFFGLYFERDCCVVATNHKLFISFLDTKINKISIENIEYVSLTSIKLDIINQNQVLVKVLVDHEIPLVVQGNIPLMATHIRRVILNEIDSREPGDEIKRSVSDYLYKKIESKQNEINVIESEIEFEPYTWINVNKSFEDNFKKIKTIYHVRRLIMGMFVVWIPVFCFSIYLASWNFNIFNYNKSRVENLFEFMPIVSSILVLVLTAGLLGSLVYFYVYQKHLHNIVVNTLCYIIMGCLTILILSVTISITSVYYVAYQFFGDEKTEPVRKIDRDSEEFYVLSTMQLFSGIFTISSVAISLVPLMILNIGIYKNNKVQ